MIEPAATTLPLDWRALFGDTAGTAILERRFNRPTGLTDGHRVRIVLREVLVLQQVSVNDHPLSVEQGADGSQVVDITQHLQPHNRLTIGLSFDPGVQPHVRGGIGQPVVLEIEEPEWPSHIPAASVEC